MEQRELISIIDEYIEFMDRKQITKDSYKRILYNYNDYITTLSISNPKRNDVLKYKVEPYVFAADVYSNEQFKAQGGWTWYTGASAWFYRIALVDILGFNLRGNKLYIKPNVAKTWKDYKITYKYHDTVYEIKVLLKQKVNEIIVDNKVNNNNDYIELKNDKKHHVVTVKVGDMNDKV